jgi:uncharacterized protein (DUF1330 family)
MSVYAVALITINDRAAYTKYEEGFSEIFRRYAGEILSVEESPRVIEGEWPYTRTVLLRFPSDARFREWYDSPAYQAIAQHRFAGSSARLVLISGRDAKPPR